MREREIIFEVTEAPEGGYDAKALGHSVFTVSHSGSSWARRDGERRSVHGDEVRSSLDQRALV